MRVRYLQKCVLLLAFLSGLPAWGCVGQAKTDLEKVLCRVKQEDPAARLPSLHEFRQNPEKTQRLLLRRPAKKLGIKLPAEAAPVAPPKKSRQASESEAAKPTAAKQPLVAADLQDCTLAGEQIRCADGLYRLQRNRPNGSLPAQALEQTQLVLPEFRVAASEASQYLSATYRSYIQAMLAIGLAEATLSYTKYVHIFNDVQQQGGDFPARMTTMFEYLKQDKKQMSAGGRPSHMVPRQIEQCQRLEQKLILCDNVAENWVFQYVGR